MKVILKTLRVILGCVFLFSGLIKQNDPLGFSYKLEEYCHVFNLDILIPYTLAISIIFCALEISIGLLLIFKIHFNKTKQASLILLVFFSFLTFYSAYFNKVKSCGCFGDVITLSPWQSFYKDLILIFINIVLFCKPKINYSSLKLTSQNIATILIFIPSIYLGIYTYKNLPIIDFSIYKIGANLQSLKTKGLLDPLAMDSSWQDYSDNILQNSDCILITSLDLQKIPNKNIVTINDIIDKAKIHNTPIYILTTSNDLAIKIFKNKLRDKVSVYFIDQTFLRTLIRAENGIIMLKKGIIVYKSNLTRFNINLLK